MKDKIISFSLWGDDPDYYIGAIKNIELAKKIYPDWTCKFYISTCVPIDIIKKISETSQVELRNKKSKFDGAFWRFEAAEDNDGITIFRDTDSRLSYREKAAVDNWILSKNKIHIMKDHPHHNAFALAGMWGVIGKLEGIKKAIQNFPSKDHYGCDQEFLEQFIDKNFSFTVHDETFSNNPFPISRKMGDPYIGEKFDKYDNFNQAKR